MDLGQEVLYKSSSSKLGKNLKLMVTLAELFPLVGPLTAKAMAYFL